MDLDELGQDGAVLELPLLRRRPTGWEPIALARPAGGRRPEAGLEEPGGVQQGFRPLVRRCRVGLGHGSQWGVSRVPDEDPDPRPRGGTPRELANLWDINPTVFTPNRGQNGTAAAPMAPGGRNPAGRTREVSTTGRATAL